MTADQRDQALVTTTHADRVEEILSGLEPRHRRVLLLLARGYRVVDVAAVVGYAAETVTRLKSRHADRLEAIVAAQDAADLEASDADYRVLLRQLRNEVGIETLRELLRSENANARARALLGLLDRTNVGPTQTVAVEARTFHEYFHSAQVQDALKALRAGEIRIIDAGPPSEQSPQESPARTV